MTPVEFKKFIDTLKALLPQHAPEFEAHQLSAWYIPFQEYPAQRLFALFPQLSATCDRFPSIKQILELLDPKADKDAEARVIADKIWSSIERFGSLKSNQDRVRAAIGEVGWQVVENMGGWRVVCDIASYDNVSQLKAQWRESAKALMEIAEVKGQRDRLGLESPPEWEALPRSSNDRNTLDVSALVSGISTRKVT